MDREHILAEIRRVAADNNGVAPGKQRFESETGIREHEWGRHWARWGDALTEAGFEPNEWVQTIPETQLLEHLAVFVRELGRFPVVRELGLRSRRQSTFPSTSAFRRFGGQRKLAIRLRQYCIEQGYGDVAELIDVPKAVQASADRSTKEENPLGFVYLIKSGRYYKIGRSNAVGRRERELDLALPEAVKLVHSIKTDDPVGIEDYWHRRFADRRKKGEWFALTPGDVTAFRRRKHM